MRITNPYGPRQQMKHGKYGIVNWFIRLALEAKPLTVFGEGLQQRDYIFVEDVAEGILNVALADGTAGQVYNLGTGVGTPFIDMVHLVAENIPGTDRQYLPWPQDRYFVETGDFIADITKLEGSHRTLGPADRPAGGHRQNHRLLTGSTGGNTGSFGSQPMFIWGKSPPAPVALGSQPWEPPSTASLALMSVAEPQDLIQKLNFFYRILMSRIFKQTRVEALAALWYRLDRRHRLITLRNLEFARAGN